MFALPGTYVKNGSVYVYLLKILLKCFTKRKSTQEIISRIKLNRIAQTYTRLHLQRNRNTVNMLMSLPICDMA